MKAFFSKNWYWFSAIIVVGVVCFFAGRKTIDQVAGIEYVKVPAIQGAVPSDQLKPKSSTTPDRPVLPMKPDTVWAKGKPYPVPGKDSIIYQPYEIVQKVDTSKIIQDYITLNEYNNTLFNNDSIGKLIVNSEVQYNKLRSLGYVYTPVQKVITKERKRVVMPFLTGSYSTFNQVAAGGGVYIKNVGIGAKYVKDVATGKTGYEGSIYLKF